MARPWRAPPDVIAAMSEPSLKSRAYALLSRREMSRAELRRKLAPHADSEAQLDALLDELTEIHHQSDARFAEAWVNSKVARHGARRLRHDLASRGVDDDTIRSALDGIEDSEVARARALWLKKFGTLPENLQEKARQIRFLAGRGFDLGVIRKALRDINLDDVGDA